MEELLEISSRSQFVTLNKSNNLRGQHYKYLPYVLTEQGIMMLSGLLKSDLAVKVNIKIIDAFVKMRTYISTDLYKNGKVLMNHENRLLILEESFKEKKNKIFFEGQIYDSYSLLIDILNKARKEIIIIDNYISKELLDVLCNINVNTIIYTKNIDNILLNKYNSQYNNINIKIDNRFHDRFIIIDNKELYHCGASIKDLGKKCFAINRVENEEFIEVIKSLCRY